jgi:hypothetical protein
VLESIEISVIPTPEKKSRKAKYYVKVTENQTSILKATPVEPTFYNLIQRDLVSNLLPGSKLRKTQLRGGALARAYDKHLALESSVYTAARVKELFTNRERSGFQTQKNEYLLPR